MLVRRPLLALIAAEVISSVGSLMTAVALPWFVLETTGSPVRMSVVLVLAGAPWAAHAGSQSAVVPELLGEDVGRVAQANALLQTLSRLAYFVGPRSAACCSRPSARRPCC